MTYIERLLNEQLKYDAHSYEYAQLEERIQRARQSEDEIIKLTHKIQDAWKRHPGSKDEHLIISVKSDGHVELSTEELG